VSGNLAAKSEISLNAFEIILFTLRNKAEISYNVLFIYQIKETRSFGGRGL
jgi:hypothetical protein